MATIFAERPTHLPISPAWWLAAIWKPATLAVFTSWVLLVGSHHEPWFDEAQAWLLARDNDLWPLLAERVRYEGTPGLWHAILWLAIRLGLPYSHLFLLPAGFAVAGAAVTLWRAPFPPALRLAILASYFFGYQFAIVARSYCLDLFLIPLAAALFASRVDRPLRYALTVGLIANTNVHSFLASGILGLELVWQLWRGGHWRSVPSVGALLLAGGSGLFALWSFWQPADNGYLQADMRPRYWISLIHYLRNAFIDRALIWSNDSITAGDVIAGAGLTLLLLRYAVPLVAAGRHRFLTVALLGALIVFSVFIYSSAWHAGLLFLFWLFLLWVQWEAPLDPKPRRDLVVAIAIICLVQATQTVRAGIWDFNNTYSPGITAARALVTYRAQHPRNSIAAFGFKAFEVQPWLSHNLFDNYRNGAARPSYVLWDRQQSWSGRVNLPAWQKLLDTQPDLILASSVDLGARRRNLMPLACKAGYGVRQKFVAALTWRGAVAEDQTLIMFERGSRNGCARQNIL